jgi:hypothetical protein
MITIRGRSKDAKQCYLESLKVGKGIEFEEKKSKPKDKGKQKFVRWDAPIMLADLDPRG